MKDLKKKTCKNVIMTILFILLAVAFEIQPAQAAVKLNASALQMFVGDTYQLKLTGTSKKVTWKSSKSSVAKVSSKGLVTAKGKGSATITATINKKSSYKCKVTVNKQFKLEKSSVSIKKNTEVIAYLPVSGAEFYVESSTNPSVCGIEYGSWSGYYIPVKIVPKKVGSTEIIFLSRKPKDPSAKTYVELERWKLKVKVTALPVDAKFRDASISTGANELIVGESKFVVPFSLNRASAKTYFKVYDESGAIVRSISLGSVKANTTKKVEWDGKDNDGNPLSGTFTYAVIADGNRTDGKNVVKVLPASPFGKGDGSQTNPYLVSNQIELYLMKNYNGAYFAQDADIDFNYGVTAQIFDSKDPFVGTFDGTYAGKKYRMLNLCGYSSVFGDIGEKGVVKNVSMSNCILNITGSLLANINEGTIESCNVDGMIFCNGGSQAAMLVMFNKGVIRDCVVSGSLNVKADNVIGATVLKVGGIAFQNSRTIAKCQSSVQIVQEINVSTYVPATMHEVYAGGIVAENLKDAVVRECVFIGSVATTVTLPDTVKDVVPAQVYKNYSGFVAGVNNGTIVRCTNASSTGSLNAKGTGDGTVQ